MPELPEVESVKRVLSPQLINRTLVAVEVFKSKIIATDLSSFLNDLNSKEIVNVERRGKFLIITLNTLDKIFIHLRMTGCLLVAPKTYPKEKHTHVIISLDNNTELRYIDSRAFGKFWLIKNGESEETTGVTKLGLEPLKDEITPDYLKSKLKNKNVAIKTALLDQGVIAGIGNIYSDEILHKAKINPETKCNALNDNEWAILSSTIEDTLYFFVEKNNITKEEYLLGKGKKYKNTPFIRIYGHAGSTCPTCLAILESTRINGRSSVYCPKCQKKKAK